MRKNKNLKIFKIFSLISFVFILFLGLCLGNVNIVANAAGNEAPAINNTNYSETYNFDNTLFQVMKMLAKQLNGNNPVAGFNVDTFSEEFKTANVAPGGGGLSDGEKLKQDLYNGVLNLTTGENARYECLINRDKIKNIAGLNSLNLSNIKTLILDDNSISYIKASDLETLDNMEVLSVKNNALTSFELNPDLTNVNELNLSGNKLKSINLQNLSIVGGVRPKCYLSGNEFTTTENIVFPASKLSKLDLSFNKLENLSQEALTLLNQNMYGSAKADIVLQGIQSFNSAKAGQKIAVYQNSLFEDFNVKVFYNENSAFYNEESSNLICETLAQDDVEELVLPAGKIKIEFYSGNTLINAANFPEASEDVLNNLSAKTCNVALEAPVYKVYLDNKEVRGLSQTDKFTVKLSLKDANLLPNAEDILNSENKAVISYVMMGTSGIKNESCISINSNGAHTYNVYVTFDGIKSQNITFQASLTDLSGIYVGIVIIVIIFVVIAASYYIIRWIKDGATIAPLTDKEIYNMNKRKERKQGFSREDYISGLDKSRHAKRVSDLGYSDDSLVEKDNINYNNYEQENNYNDVEVDYSGNEDLLTDLDSSDEENDD